MDNNECISLDLNTDESLHQLIYIHKEQLYRIAYSYLKNEDDALEAIQETAFRAYKNKNKLKNPKHVQTWLIRIMINYCIDELNRKKKTKQYIKDTASYCSEIDDKKIEMESIIEQLEPKYRQVISLKYFEDLKISDIALIINRPEGTIKTWLNKALKKLKILLNEDGEYYV